MNMVHSRAPSSGANAANPSRQNLSPKLVRLLQGLVGIVGFCLVWQAFASMHLVSADYFPSAWAVVTYSVGLLFHATFLTQVWATLEAMLIGLAFATVVAVPVGLLLGKAPVAYRMTQFIVETMRPIPAVALAPLAILLFGLSSRSTVFLVIWTSVWPILINSVYGMHSVDPLRRQAARTFGFGKLRTLVLVEVPSCAPLIVTGIRISLGIALSVAIAGEMVASSGNGLGGWILQESSGGSLLPIYGGTVVAGILGYLLNLLTEGLEARFFFWHASHRNHV